MIILYLWYLFSTPIDKISCYLWMDKLPTKADLVQACGQSIADNLDRYKVTITSIDGRVTECIIPAAEIYTNDCGTGRNLNQHHINLVIPDYQTVLCTIELNQPGQPTSSDIDQQCDRAILDDSPGEVLEMRYMGTREVEPEQPTVCALPPLEIGDGIYQAPMSILELATHENYQLLDQLITFHDQSVEMSSWQNRYDPWIYISAKKASVPARLLKAMIGVESQFWPTWAPSDAGEVGLLQVTDSGADIALRYSPQLQDLYCSQAIDPNRCKLGYQVLSSSEQQMIRDVFRRDLYCQDCQVHEAIRKITWYMDIYADTLAAFRCYAGEVPHDPNTDIWDITVALYHAGPGCVKDGICPAGLDYLQKLKE